MNRIFRLLLPLLLLAASPAFAQMSSNWTSDLQYSQARNTTGTVIITTNGAATVTVNASGSASGMTFAFQGTNDGTHWATLQGFVPSTGVSNTSFSADGNWIIPVAGFATVRVNLTAISGGTETFALESGTRQNAAIIPGAITATQSTPTNLNAAVSGPTAAGSAASTPPVIIGGTSTGGATGTVVNAMIGQGTKAQSLSVTTPSDPDYRPVAANITIIDSGSSTTAGYNSVNVITGTPTASSFASWAVNGQSAVTVTVSALVGTLSFEASNDAGTTWVAVSMRQRGGSFIGSSTTGIGIFDGDVSGKTNFRVRATAAITGTATVTSTFSGVNNVVQVINPVTTGASRHLVSTTLTKITGSQTYSATTTAPQAICLFASVTACAPVTVTPSASNPMANGYLTRVMLEKSTTGATAANFRIFAFQGAPTLTGIYNTSAYLVPAADITSGAYVGSWDCTSQVVNTDNSFYDCVANAPSGNNAFNLTTGNLSFVITAIGAYVSGSSETFNVLTDTIQSTP